MSKLSAMTNQENPTKKNNSINTWGLRLFNLISLAILTVPVLAQSNDAPADAGPDSHYWLTAGIIIAAAVLITTLRALAKAKKALASEAFGAEPQKNATLWNKFLLIVGVTILLVVGFKMLSQGNFNYNYILFAALPYVCFVVFIIGSVFRYRNKGFKVSSLSSQFLEGKNLFWGSQPFHWGILILFFGHLIAFLFPSAVLAWNGMTVRLLILEISSFIFGLSALFGLLLLIRRRLNNRRLQVVSNTMDMVVYAVLLLQIISGLSVAFFDRWGSSWFASSMTPYLRSVFALNPKVEVVSAMPWEVQLHVVSAFIIIGIIPFTRFMHFLVAPVDYIWRRYQLVIWNYSYKGIRTSKRYFPGKKSRNH